MYIKAKLNKLHGQTNIDKNKVTVPINLKRISFGNMSKHFM